MAPNLFCNGRTLSGMQLLEFPSSNPRAPKYLTNTALVRIAVYREKILWLIINNRWELLTMFQFLLGNPQARWDNPSRDFCVCLSLTLVGHAAKTSTGTSPGGLVIRCQNHLMPSTYLCMSILPSLLNKPVILKRNLPCSQISQC